MKSIGIIPSRYSSTRFPGKPLIDIGGKSMIQRVYEQTLKSKLLSKVIIATDDERIFNHVLSFNGEVIMTDVSHTNGTTRCNQVISLLEDNNEEFDVVVNIQGDEPTINPKQIDSVISLFSDSGVEIGTLAKKITLDKELFDHNVVKVVMSNNNKALYFSRQAIPMIRDFEKNTWLEKTNYFKHIGIYGYRASVLKQICEMPVGILEHAESLEQLRWLENGISIYVNLTDFESIAIDTPEDLLKLETNS